MADEILTNPVSGQKRGPAVRLALLLAARDVFTETGFDQASMDTVALRAGVTKRTVYAHCSSKAALFADVIGTACRGIVERLPQTADLEPDPAIGVRSYLTAAVEIFESDGCVPLKRVILAEAPRHPEFIEMLGAAYEQVEDRLSDYLHTAAAAGRLRPHDTRQAARALCNATVLAGSLRGLLGRPTSSAEDIDQAVSRYLATACRSVNRRG